MLKTVRARFQVLLFALLCANLSAHACDEARLGTQAQVLAKSIERALNRGVLTDADVQAFLRSETWTNPYLVSATHFLKGQYQAVFEANERNLRDADRPLVKMYLRNILAARADGQLVLEEASRATEMVLLNRKLHGLPDLAPRGYKEKGRYSPVMGRLNGRPVFAVQLSTNRVEPSHYLYDPQNPDPTKRLIVSETAIPMETLPFNRPLSTVWVGGKYLRFLDENGNQLSTFSPAGGEKLSNTTRAPVRVNGRIYATAALQKDKVASAVVIDASTGAPLRTIEGGFGAPLTGVILKRGAPQFFGYDGAQSRWKFVDIDSGQESFVGTGIDTPYWIKQFHYQGRDFLVWREWEHAVILDVDRDEISHFKVSGRYNDEVFQFYEYQGAAFVVFGADLDDHFQITGATRGPSSVSECGDRRLGSRVQNLAHVLDQALERGILTESDIFGFLNSAIWTNPFLTSGVHLLRSQYAELFTKLEHDLGGEGQAGVKAHLRKMLEVREGLSRLAADAERATERVFVFRELMTYPRYDVDFALTTEFELRRYQGRPVFVAKAHDVRLKSALDVLFDPHNPDSKQRIRTDWDPEAAAPVPALPGPQTRRVDSYNVDFLAEDGTKLASFRPSEPESRVSLKREQPAPMRYGDQILAPVVAHASGGYRYNVYVVNGKTGETLRTIPASYIKSTGFAYRKGVPQFFLTRASMNGRTWEFTSLVDGQKTLIETEGDCTWFNVFHFAGRDFILWRTDSKFGVLDIDFGTNQFFPISGTSYESKGTLYEFGGDVYLFMGKGSDQLFQLTGASRGPASAQDCGDRRLGTHVQFLAKSLERALERGVLSDADVQGFLHSETWINPYLDSATHFLKGQYQAVFEANEKNLREEEKPLVKTFLRNILAARADGRRVSEEASRATETVILNRPFPGLPDLAPSGYKSKGRYSPVRGVLGGRPVFTVKLSTNRIEPSHYLFDPHNPNPTKRLVISEVPFAVEPVPPAPAMRTTVIGAKTVRIFDEADRLLSTFTVPSHDVVINEGQTTPIRYGDRIFALVTDARALKGHVVDAQTGQPLRTLPDVLPKKHTIVYKRGVPHIVYRDPAGLPGWKFVSMMDGEESFVETSLEHPYWTNRFHYQGRDFLVWREWERAGILDVDRGEISYLTVGGSYSGESFQFYEYQGGAYIIFGADLDSPFQIIGKSRGPSSVPACDEGRLGSHAQALAKMLERALDRGVLTEAEMAAFQNASRWANPFVISSANLLKSQYRDLFDKMDRELPEAERARVLEHLQKLLAARAGLAQVARDASHATERVFVYRPLPALSTFLKDVEVIDRFMPGTLDGRPAFIARVVRDETIRETVLFDPHNPDPAKRAILSKLPATIQEWVHKPSLEAYALDAHRVQFFDENGTALAAFQPERGFIEPKQPRPLRYKDQAFAAIIYSEHSGPFEAHLVNCMTGLSSKSVPVRGVAMNAVVYRRGVPQIAYFDAPNRGFKFISLVDGSESFIHTGGEGTLWLKHFSFGGHDYLIWRAGGEPLSILDIDGESVSTLQVATEPSDSRVFFYEYQGNLYMLLGPGFEQHFQLTGASRGPASAEDCGDRRLSSHAQSMAKMLERALAQGVLNEEQIAAFQKSATWSNPFLTSSAHLLKNQYLELFDHMNGALPEAERPSVLRHLQNLLAARAGLHQTSADAIRATERVFVNRELPPFLRFPQSDLNLTSTFELRMYQGRRVFYERARDMARNTDLDFLYDPHSPDPSRRILTEWDRNAEAWPENKTPTTELVGSQTVQFVAEDGSKLATFSIPPEQGRFVGGQPDPLRRGDSIFAPVFIEKPGGGYEVHTVDAKSGRDLHALGVDNKSNIGFVYRDGVPHSYRIYGDAPHGNRWVLTNLLNGKEITIRTEGVGAVWSRRVHFMGRDYIIWRDSTDKVGILNVNSGDNMFMKVEGNAYSGIHIIYEYQGDLFLVLSNYLDLHYQLTGHTRGPSSIGSGDGCGRRLERHAQSLVGVFKAAMLRSVITPEAAAKFLEGEWTNPFPAQPFHPLKRSFGEAFDVLNAVLSDTDREQFKLALAELLRNQAGDRDIQEKAEDSTRAVLAPRELPVDSAGRAFGSDLSLGTFEGRPAFISYLRILDPHSPRRPWELTKYDHIPSVFKAPSPLRNGRVENKKLVKFYSDDDTLISEFKLPSRTGEVMETVMPGRGSGLAHALVLYSTKTSYAAYFVDVATGKKIGSPVKLNDPSSVKLIYVNDVPYLFAKDATLFSQAVSIRLVSSATGEESITATESGLVGLEQFRLRGTDYLIWREDRRMAIFNPVTREIIYTPAAPCETFGRTFVYEYQGNLYATFGPGVSSYFQLTQRQP